ncbi:MAG: fluoride efflux transporter CrcB [Candidatus Diapherotrites archaeon]|nr:fluoride efflux transporter CrcB [Candidatus Diapherotrites archaeon]
MYLIWLIGIGGFLGAIARYLVGGWIQNGITAFPLGTLTVNFSGSLLLGLIMYSSEYLGFFSEETRVFLTIGFLGAFTTMSTFSYESFRLMEQNNWVLFGINVAGTILLTIFAVYLAKLAVLKIGGM